MCYQKSATDAACNGDLNKSIRICLDAVREFEAAGEDRDASTAFHFLGKLCYQYGDCTSAERFMRKSIEVDLRIGDDDSLGHSRTCNNLAAVANAKGEHGVAREWLAKSIRIKERVGDDRGLAASYHQLGVVAESEQKYDDAEQAYVRSLELEKSIGNNSGAVRTMLNISKIEHLRGNFDLAAIWHQQAMETLTNKIDFFSAVEIAQDAERAGGLETARELYEVAGKIARGSGDSEKAAMCLASQERLHNEMTQSKIPQRFGWFKRLTGNWFNPVEKRELGESDGETVRVLSNKPAEQEKA
jgi:tetratricopeptide (TPR) repeat protein